MEPDRWEEVESIFQKALDAGETGRDSVLEKCCAGDDTLRSEVESLLAQHAEAGDFLEVPLFAATELQPAEISAPLLNTEVGHFRILEKIGSGGMGVVYKAEDLKLSRYVALKFLPDAVAGDPGSLSRFRLEARAASALNHPGICTIYEVDEDQGRVFLAMELLEGETLRQAIAGNPLPFATAIDFGVQIAQAMECAHAAGIVHRDLKPANIFLTQRRRIKVLDFGLAKMTQRLPQWQQADAPLSLATEAGVLLGTPGYMAPEQIRGQTIDHRVDIFAFGAIMYEMLAGARAFHEPTPAETFAAILKEEPRPISQLAPDVPLSLVTVVKRCLEKDPEQRFQSASDLALALEKVSEGQSTSAPANSGSRTRWVWPRSAVMYVAGGALLTVLLALAVWLTHTAIFGPRLRSLAVLPLENLSGDPNQEYLADGMTDELITSLGQIGALRVISRTTAMQYKNAHKPLPQIARELNVDAVVEGSVLQSADRVRIAAQLVDARTEKQLWAQTYDGDMRDVLGLQSQVASAVAAQIRTKLTAKEHTQLADTQNVDPRAYEALLKGNYFFRQNTPDTTKKALQYFQQAVQLDPTLARGYVGIARCYNFLGEGGVSAGEAMATADAAVAKALELQPDLSEAYAERGWTLLFYHWDFPGTERDFRHAIELNPGSSDAHEGYGTYLTIMGKFDAGLLELQKARDLDPLSPFLLANYCWMLHFARRYGEAETQCLASLELDPHFEWGMEHTIDVYFDLKNYAKANEYLSKMDGCDALCVAMADEISGEPGKRGAFDIWLKSLKEKPDALFLAAAYSGLGRKDEAFEALEKAYELRSNPHDLTFVPVDPQFDPLRSDPRFDAFLRRAGLPPQPQQFRGLTK